ncbi:hypothetical protein F5H01DRAFT_327705 [Linnemannia elongata]|nr:hypothetical protein F5H01DRAFT_327705 [Linnemannia elongata]
MSNFAIALDFFVVAAYVRMVYVYVVASARRSLLLIVITTPLSCNHPLPFYSLILALSSHNTQPHSTVDRACSLALLLFLGPKQESSTYV